MRGQGSLEYLILVAAILSISSVIVLFLTGSFGSGSASASVAACKQAAANCQTQKLVTPGATCNECATACLDSNGRDVMSDSQGCGPACGFCKVGLASRIESGVKIPSGAIGFWPFEEGIGTTTVDASANKNTGTVNGATWTSSGKFGNALTFDGVNDFVNCGTSASLKPTTAITVSAWAYIPSALGAFTAFVKQNPGNLGWSLEGSSTKFWIYTGSWTSSRGTTLSFNTWHHVAATYDGAYIRLYVDGIEITPAVAKTGAILYGGDSSDGLCAVGHDSYDPTNIARHFKGTMDEVAIYARALTAGEITQLYNAGK